MNTQILSIRRQLYAVTRCMFILFLLAGFVWATPVEYASAKGGGDFMAGEVIVKLDPLAGATIDDINGTHNTTTLKALEPGSGIYLLELPPGDDPMKQAEVMAGYPRLSFAEPNFITHPPEANPRSISRWGGLDPTPYFVQYAIDQLNLTEAWAINRGAGSLVAVIDTGVQLAHPALVSSLTSSGYDFVDNDNVPEDEFPGLDSDGDGVADEAAGHGTHVAGIVHLVAPDAKIMPLRVLDSNGDGDIFTVAQAMIYAIQNHADVINLSLGTPDKSDLLKDVVSEATHNNVVVVAAAGNLNSKLPQYPAANNCALSVTSVGPTGFKSNFSNFDSGVDFAASGESIFSSFPIDGYAYWSGTSMATPFISGQVALLHSVDPTLNPRDLALFMGETAHSIDTLNPQYTGKLGMGLVDIGGSLELLVGGTVPSANHGVIGMSCVK